MAGLNDWRVTMRSRLVVGAVVFALWTVGIEARLVYLQVVEHADMLTRAERQQMRTLKRRPNAATSSIATAACSPTASTPTPIYAVPPNRGRRAARAAVCGALDDCAAKERQRWPGACAATHSSPTSRARSRPTRRTRAGAGPDGVGFIKESRRSIRTRSCGARARLRRHRQRRAARSRVDVRRADPRPRGARAGADRRAAAGVQPGRAPADRGRRLSS